MTTKVRIFRRSYTKPIPDKATISRRWGRGGGKMATWSKMRADGTCEVYTAPLTKDGSRIMCWSRNWFLSFEDARQIKCEIKAYDGEEASRVAQAKLAELLDYRAAGKSSPTLEQWFDAPEQEALRQELVRVGVLDPVEPEDATNGVLLLDDLVTEFEKCLVFERERCSRYVVAQISILNRIFGDCGFRAWNDISADKVKAWLLAQRNGSPGCSKRTYNQFTQTLRQFGKYVVDELELADVNPLRKLKPLPNMETDQRHPRRILTPEELQRVLAAAAAAPSRKGLDGPTRSLLYWFMASTGLRLGECRTLVVSDLRLNSLDPHVSVKAAHIKNSQSAELPLKRDLADALKDYVQQSNKLPTAVLFSGSRKEINDHLADAFALDLRDAGIAYRDDAGEYADLHSLRHYFGTRLAESDLSIHEVQRLMRHGSIVTTQRYMHAAKDRMRKGVESLPKLSIKSA